MQFNIISNKLQAIVNNCYKKNKLSLTGHYINLYSLNQIFLLLIVPQNSKI